MENIKALLIEKERRSYNNGETGLAAFLGEVLDHIVELEKTINAQDSKIEDLETERAAEKYRSD